MAQMVFTVPPFSLALVLVAEQPLDAAGRPAAAVVETNTGLIYLWAGLSAPMRENSLRHELWHAWEYHFAAEKLGDEARCQLFANASQHFDAELRRQGGVDALAALRPAGLAAVTTSVPPEIPLAGGDLDDEHVEHLAVRELRLEPVEEFDQVVDDAVGLRGRFWGSAHRRDCYACGSFVWGGAIATTRPPYFLDQVDGRPVEGWVVDRACVCQACGVLQEWTEGVGPDGRPNCVPVAEPVQTSPATKKGRERIGAFLSKHASGYGQPA